MRFRARWSCFSWKMYRWGSAFLPHTPQEAFADRISSGSVIWCFKKLNNTGCRHTSETGPKFSIVITDQVLWCLPIRSGFSELLRDPGIRRRPRDANMDHPSRLKFDEEESAREVEKRDQSPVRSHRPRFVRRGCAGTLHTSVRLV